MGTEGEIKGEKQNKEDVLHWHSMKNKIRKVFHLEERRGDERDFQLLI